MESTEERLKKELGVDRSTRRTDRQVTEARGMDDRRVTEDREISDDDRLEMFRNKLSNGALPNLPPIPGYHLCWLTTTNNADSIHSRMLLGYEPVTVADAPGLEYASVKTGEFAGHIAVNEMLAFKLPLRLYEAYMQEAHHDAPLRDEQRLADVLEQIRQQGTEDGLAFDEGDGTKELREMSAPRRGRFDD